MWFLGLHVLPTPSPVRLSVPGGSAPSAPHSPSIPAAPTPSNPDQFLKTEHSYPRGRRGYPRGRREPPSAHSVWAQNLGPASVPAGKSHLPTVGRCPQHGHGHLGSPGSPRAVAAILLLPTLSPSSGSWAGSRARSHPHGSGKAGFPCAPGKQGGGGGKMESFPLWDCSKSKGELPSPLGHTQGR